MAEPVSVIPQTDNPKEVSIATTLIPWRKDDFRARYLGYLACGFNPDEALYMLGLKAEWLEEQRQDKQFSDYELMVPEIRKELSKEYIELDFFRNFRMVLEKDYRVLKEALEAPGGVVSMQSHQYLLKLRSAYTPQQLQILEQVMRGVGEGEWNFAKFVKEHQGEIVELSQTNKITMRGRLQDGSEKDNNSQSSSGIQKEH
jgi:hypothetical protein